MDVKDDMGRTPLHWIVNGNLVDMANLLISHGADVNTSDNEGKTLLELASEKNHAPMIELLKNYS